MEGWVQARPLLRLNKVAEVASRVLVFMAAGITLLYALTIAYVAMYDAPYWDLWQHVNLGNLPNGLLDRNNEHPIATGRLLFWVDDVLFSGTSRFVQIVSLLGLAAQVALFVWLARLTGAKGQLLMVGAVGASLVFYPFGFENTIWIFQVPMVLAFTSAVGGFVCFADFASRGGKSALAGSVVLAFLGVLSFANGVLVPTMLGAMAAWLRRPKAAIVFAVVALVAWIWQFSAGGGGVHEMPSPAEVVHHFLVQLGGPIGWAWGYLWKLGGPSVDNVFAATIAGAIVLLLALLTLAYIAVRRRRDPAALAAAAIILFSLATAALVTLARSYMGPGQALSSRYNINAAILYSAIFVVSLASLPEWPAILRKAFAWLAPVFAFVLLVMSATSVPMLQDLAGRYRAGLAGAVTLVTGARDEAAVGQLYFNYNFAVEQTAIFRRKNTWMFADPIARRMGEELDDEELSAPPCAGSSWTVFTPDGALYRRADGHVARQTLSSGASHVIITDPSGVIVGYGRIPRRASDLNPFVQNDGRPIDWIGRIRPTLETPLLAWLGDSNRVRCALGDPAS